MKFDILLLDELVSVLDFILIGMVEEIFVNLKEDYMIIIVMYNM